MIFAFNPWIHFDVLYYFICVIYLDVVAHTCNPNTWDAEAERLPWIPGQLGLHSEFQIRLGMICLRKQRNNAVVSYNLTWSSLMQCPGTHTMPILTLHSLILPHPASDMLDSCLNSMSIQFASLSIFFLCPIWEYIRKASSLWNWIITSRSFFKFRPRLKEPLISPDLSVLSLGQCLGP